MQKSAYGREGAETIRSLRSVNRDPGSVSIVPPSSAGRDRVPRISKICARSKPNRVLFECSDEPQTACQPSANPTLPTPAGIGERIAELERAFETENSLPSCVRPLRAPLGPQLCGHIGKLTSDALSLHHLRSSTVLLANCRTICADAPRIGACFLTLISGTEDAETDSSPRVHSNTSIRL